MMRGVLAWLWLSTIALSAFASNQNLDELSKRHTRRTKNGIHLPIVRREVPALRKRGLDGAIGLGNFRDITYNVLVTIGSRASPVVLDTGSSDLWVISDACTSGCVGDIDVPLYPQATFKSTGLDARLFYGDSQTGTHAFGLIGSDTVNLAGLVLPDQYFAAINSTNTSVVDTGSAGIFGLGFPINSGIWSAVFVEYTNGGRNSRRGAPSNAAGYGTRYFPNLNFNRKPFPTISGMYPSSTQSRHKSRQQSPASSFTNTIFQSYSSTGPLLTRFVAAGYLSLPMFTVTLQRDTVDIGGNVGMLSIGELPEGISNESVTWVPVRTYTPAQGGLRPPLDSPNEVYPIAWEIFIDDVYFDGEKLPRSSLSPSAIALSALIDTGNSLLRGPADIVQNIRDRLGPQGAFPCSQPHVLEFEIGGKMFPVDPRDFASQALMDTVSTCVPNLAATDPPREGGYLYSWSLGDPFLKSVLSAYHYGNLSYPSQDPGRIGLLSTVPEDADNRMRAAVQAAQGGNFPATYEPAPSGTRPVVSTNSNGVPVTEQTKRPGSTNGASAGSSGASFSSFCVGLVVVLVAAVPGLLS